MTARSKAVIIPFFVYPHLKVREAEGIASSRSSEPQHSRVVSPEEQVCMCVRVQLLNSFVRAHLCVPSIYRNADIIQSTPLVPHNLEAGGNKEDLGETDRHVAGSLGGD